MLPSRRTVIGVIAFSTISRTCASLPASLKRASMHSGAVPSATFVRSALCRFCNKSRGSPGSDAKRTRSTALLVTRSRRHRDDRSTSAWNGLLAATPACIAAWRSSATAMRWLTRSSCCAWATRGSSPKRPVTAASGKKTAGTRTQSACAMEPAISPR